MSGSVSPPPLPPNIGLLAGPQLLGFFFSWALQGILTTQACKYHLAVIAANIYYLYFPDDRRWTKCLVAGVVIWEWIQTGLVTQTAFNIDVTHFGDISVLTAYGNTWFSVPIMSAVVSFVVQCYFAWRVWVLGRSRIAVGVILFLSFTQTVLGIAGGVTLKIIEANAVEASVNRPIVAAGLVVATVVDVLIAALMTYYLLQARSGIRQSDAIINKLVSLVIETGALTATVACLYCVVFLVDTKDLLFECPYAFPSLRSAHSADPILFGRLGHTGAHCSALVLPKLYSNTLIVSLNNRAFVRGAISKSLNSSSRGTSAAFGPTVFSRNTFEEASRARGGIESGAVHIDVDVVESGTYDGHPKSALELVPMDGAGAAEAGGSARYGRRKQ
ncbi:uncharacterized protein BXZ73DRAFT_101030 [Epithele typhae]|uniref:uncharacterized protein n=1 Tax=Epithele typhae TaxID=378194 RepID=UPI0020083E3E|nr:uncharacterized protein BXZ73DRAFT_101030 [Epithele typhae]KAH9933646.1 hypothetical protein BXZ73DRAFT_101030 [Epithele typhae]